MTTALARSTWQLPQPGEWQTMMDMAEMFLKSGLLPSSIKTAAAAVTIIQKGRELGVPPLYALSNISIIDGKPATGAEMIGALIYRDHGDLALDVVETTDERCTVRYRRRHQPEYRTLTFTLDDAKQAGLLNKPTWRQYPKTMLRWRALSAVGKLAFPDSVGGLYNPEELGAEVAVTEDDQVVVVQQPDPPIRDARFKALTESSEDAIDEVEQAAGVIFDAEPEPLPSLAEAFANRLERMQHGDTQAYESFRQDSLAARKLGKFNDDEWQELTELAKRAKAEKELG